MVLPTVVNVLLALLPRVVMAAMHTTMIRASMTAYSTAVGPSSRRRNFTTLLANFFIVFSFGSLAIREAAPWRTHDFAPPPYGGFAVSWSGEHPRSVPAHV